MWHPEVTGSHYQDYALLRNEDERNLFISLLESISPVNFSLKLKEPQLNQEKYWLAQPMMYVLCYNPGSLLVHLF